FAFVWAGRAASQDLGPDPVKDFQEALKADREGANLEERMAFRKKNLEEKEKRLVHLGDLSRVLLIHGWRASLLKSDGPFNPPDGVIRERLLRRLLDELKTVLRSGNAASQAAAAQLINSTAEKVRDVSQKESELFTHDVIIIIPGDARPVVVSFRDQLG